MTTRTKRTAKPRQIEALIGSDRVLLKELMKEALQEVLEAEMTEALGAGPGERLVERGGLAHACGREQSLACGVGTPEPSDSTPGSAAEHLNRRVRNRTHGGVGGRDG